jgi:hypothetical protein
VNDLTDLIVSQFLDPFRIVLLIALVMTAYNTAATAGMAIPLTLGAIFVAVLLPLTTQAGETGTTTSILTGIGVNAVLVGIILAGRAAWKRLTAPGGS